MVYWLCNVEWDIQSGLVIYLVFETWAPQNPTLVITRFPIESLGLRKPHMASAEVVKQIPKNSTRKKKNIERRTCPCLRQMVLIHLYSFVYTILALRSSLPIRNDLLENPRFRSIISQNIHTHIYIYKKRTFMYRPFPSGRPVWLFVLSHIIPHRKKKSYNFPRVFPWISQEIRTFFEILSIHQVLHPSRQWHHEAQKVLQHSWFGLYDLMKRGHTKGEIGKSWVVIWSFQEYHNMTHNDEHE